MSWLASNKKAAPAAALASQQGKESAQESANAFIVAKHRDYVRKSNYFQWLYYATRLIAGISAGLVPVTISLDARIATGLSILVVVAIVVETVFDPKKRWALYSRVTDALSIEEMRQKGVYNQHRRRIDLIFQTEQELVSELRPIADVLEALKKQKEHEVS